MQLLNLPYYASNFLVAHVKGELLFAYLLITSCDKPTDKIGNNDNSIQSKLKQKISDQLFNYFPFVEISPMLEWDLFGNG